MTREKGPIGALFFIARHVALERLATPSSRASTRPRVRPADRAARRARARVTPRAVGDNRHVRPVRVRRDRRASFAQGTRRGYFCARSRVSARARRRRACAGRGRGRAGGDGATSARTSRWGGRGDARARCRGWGARRGWWRNFSVGCARERVERRSRALARRRPSTREGASETLKGCGEG